MSIYEVCTKFETLLFILPFTMLRYSLLLYSDIMKSRSETKKTSARTSKKLLRVRDRLSLQMEFLPNEVTVGRKYKDIGG